MAGEDWKSFVRIATLGGAAQLFVRSVPADDRAGFCSLAGTGQKFLSQAITVCSEFVKVSNIFHPNTFPLILNLMGAGSVSVG